MKNVDHVQSVLFRMEIDGKVVTAGVFQRNRLDTTVWALHTCGQVLGVDVVEHQV